MIYNLTDNVSRNYWSQGRIVFKGNAAEAVKFWSNLHGSQSEPIATYMQDADGVVIVDVTDYLRTYNATLNGQITIYFQIGANTYSHTMTNVGLISPYWVFIPEISELGQLFYSDIFAPSAMLRPISSNAPIIFEMYGDSYNFSTGKVKQLPSNTVSDFARSNALLATTSEVEFWHLNDYSNGSIMLKELDDCLQYVAVEWISFTGIKRRHTFEVRKQKTANDGSYNLLGVDNEYIQIKGRVDSFRLHLGDLDTYDMWYYLDVVNSSDVRVSFNGYDWARVEVTEKNYTLPDGEAEKNGEIEITLNWKRYDAVAM